MRADSLSQLPDPLLLRRLSELVHREHAALASLLAHLGEVDARQLFVPAAYPSMYAFCVEELRFSEDAACKRIRVARASREFPALLEAIAGGRLNLGGAVLLAPHLTPSRASELIEAAAHLPRAAIARLLAGRFPARDIPARLEEVHSASAAPPPPQAPAATAGEDPSAPGRMTPEADSGSAGRLKPLSPKRFALQVTIGELTHDKLRYAQSLLGHAVPSGDLAQVIDRALDELIHVLERRRLAVAARLRPKRARTGAGPRTIPALVRKQVWERDGGRCTFVSESGRRCRADRRLEFDHITPVARGGGASVEGLRLRCQAHNQYAAESVFGAGFMRAKRAAAQRRRQARPDTRGLLAPEPLGKPRPDQELIDLLTAFGYRDDEVSAAVAPCAHLNGAPLETRIAAALAHMPPPS